MIILTEVSKEVRKRISNDLGESALLRIHENGERELYSSLHFTSDVAVYFSNDMDYVILHRGKDFCTIDLNLFENLIIA